MDSNKESKENKAATSSSRISPQFDAHSIQHQQLRRPEGNESILAFQAGGLPGAMGGTNFASSSTSMPISQQQRMYLDTGQQHGSPQMRDNGPMKSHGHEQPVLNPVHQAYLQYAYQAAQQKAALNLQSQQQGPLGMTGPSSGKDQDMRMANPNMQDLIYMQAANQAQASSSRKSSESFTLGEKQIEQRQQPVSDQRSDPKPPMQHMTIPQSPAGNMIRPMQIQTTPQGIQNMGNNQIAMAQLQAVQAWALERNIDLSQPANANLVARLIPLMQSRVMAQQKANDGNSQSSPVPMQRQHVNSPSVASDSPRANSSSELSGQSASAKARQAVQSGPFSPSSGSPVVSNPGNLHMQQFSLLSRENQGPSVQASAAVDRTPSVQTPRPSVNLNQGLDQPSHVKGSVAGINQGLDQPSHVKASVAGINNQETLQMQHLRQLNRSSPQPTNSSNDGASGKKLPSQAGAPPHISQQRTGFTKQQLHVLKAQILAFRRIKQKGEGTLPQELLQAIAPPPLELQLQQPVVPPGTMSQEISAGKNGDETFRSTAPVDKDSEAPSPAARRTSKEEASAGNDKASSVRAPILGSNVGTSEPPSMAPSGKEEQRTSTASVKTEQEVEHDTQKSLTANDSSTDRGKAVAPQLTASDAMPPLKKPSLQTSTATPPKDIAPARKYHGPLFDFPFFTRKHDSLGSAMMPNNNNLTLAYDVKDLLFEEGVEVLSKKRAENLEKIGSLLAVNLERKRIRPDLVLRLKIEEKKLKLLDLQARLREKVDQEQQEIMGMSDREYRKFVKLCERQRLELSRQVQASQKAMREKQLKSIFQWRKKLLEAHWAIRDARTARNRGVAKYHERMLREFSKRKDDDRNKRMEALKNNDVERYREMLLEQQTSIPGDAAERYNVLSTFLSQTEEYLYKLGSKIAAAKNQQEVEEAAAVAAAAARAQGLSEEEIRAAAGCAGEEVMIRNRFTEMNAPRVDSSAGKYYTLAHAVTERVARQPSMLRAGTLRDYQLVGLQWMLSLYNNKLNGILADEMGLGKTVQVMALIAYLMEFKGNYGPHLIIVPNAVLVNWKSEFLNWLPSVSCIFYVGGKEQRSKLFSQEVLAMKFNVLVTTYEFIMFDRSKLSKVDWKYIVIDEAQRMKDRDSVLARDLDRYRCQRRLLLTGTPLQNDLKELWSLLNLLLPEVFDNRKAFHDWFSQPFQRETHTHNAEDDWLETEKKVIVIHRLHQILEPFMLRRRVEDVEGSLPPKVSFVLKCKMSPFQSAIYDWVKATGTLRVDPEDEKLRVQRNHLYQAKTYKTLNNRCMELRKVCNHPLLSYPYFGDLSKDFLVRSCGKLWILDRILIKLQRTGHRVLLFSTMTKLLDILEEYLQWRRLVYRRIDGTTALEDRETAIVDFNSPDTDCFIFLLSIRAAGRGLNLQSADTVIIYDPDPNPKNEEQAVARAHRIGQTREVKVIYMEAVVDKISGQQKEDEYRSGGLVDMEDDLAGKDRYMGSIESLIRNNIQQYKIDMADEVINAGRFDQRTTHEERRMTLETLLHDEERYQEMVHDVPSLQEVNRLIARSEEEVELFDQMDEEYDWSEEMMRYDEVPDWLRASTKEVNATIAALSKKPSKDIFTSTVPADSGADAENRRGRRKGKKFPVYTELDDDNGEFSEASSEEQNGDPGHDEDGEIGESEEEEEGAAPVANKVQLEDDGRLCDDYDYNPIIGNTKKGHLRGAPRSPGSSSDSRRLTKTISPSIASQKFTTLSSLDARPNSLSKMLPEELEEGEIAVSGDSHMDLQQSGSWNHEREEGDEEQVVQPKIKRKRSIRLRPRHHVEKQEDRCSNEKRSLHQGDSSQFSFQVGKSRSFERTPRNDRDVKMIGESLAAKQDQSESSSKIRRSLPSRKTGNASKLHSTAKSSRVDAVNESGEISRESWDDKFVDPGANKIFGSKMSNVIQRRCKNVISKLQRRIDKEGNQIVPLLADLWKRIGGSNYTSGPGNQLLILSRIDQRIDGLEYNGVMEVVHDVQMMLKSSIKYYNFSHEVRSEARKVHDLFFEILKIAFPDSDFGDAKKAISFSGSAATSATASAPAPSKSAAVGQSKRHKLMNEFEQDTGMSSKPSFRGATGAGEDVRPRVHVSGKESRLRSSSSSQEQAQQDDPPVLTHPGELVVCKRKRKDREKSLVKTRTGSAGPVSPSMGHGMRSPDTVSTPRELRSNPQNAHQQAWANQTTQQVNGSGRTVGWANPVKRLRTDAGKRRPSHL